MTITHEQWLNLTIEDAIDPQLPICDAHHHLWDRPGNRYMLDEFLRDIGKGHDITHTVFVQCDEMYRALGPEKLKPVGETEFVQGIAAQSASGRYGRTAVAAGIVGFADLTLGSAVTPVLEAQKAASPNRFRGIRHSSSWEETGTIITPVHAPRGLLMDRKFREGFSYLNKYDLSFDAWSYYLQLTELLDLARAFPDTQIILNHIGGILGIGSYAGKRDEIFQEWKKGISELSECPNIVVKLGGLGMPYCGFGWDKKVMPPNSKELAEAMSPYYLWCIEKFGTDRCMFESNFPEDKKSYSYTVMWNAFKRITSDFSKNERHALFHDNAMRIYRLV